VGHHDHVATHGPDPAPPGATGGGTVYGGRGGPVAPGPPHRDRLLIGAAAVGGAGLLVGALLATGLTPFGPADRGARDAATATPVIAAPDAAGSPVDRPSSPTAPPATSAPPAAPPTGTLRSVASSLCLEPVAPDPPADGTPVHQVPCTGVPAQLWRLDRAGDVVTLVNPAAEGCLDVAGGSPDNQAPVVLSGCRAEPRQQWRATPNGNGFAVVSLVSNRCLDVPAASGDQGVRIQQFDCNGSGAQQWVFAG
jgi:hypothetical protein